MARESNWVMDLHRAEPRGVVQSRSLVRRLRDDPQYTLPEFVLRLAQAEYEHRFGRSQDYERMQERAGLGIEEVIGLLADYCVRLGGKPTMPRSRLGGGETTESEVEP